MDKGFIYVSSNPTMPGMYLVGYKPISIASHLSAVPVTPELSVPFTVEYWCLTESPEEITDMVFDRLLPFRVEGTREFYQADLEVIISTIDALIKPIQTS